MSTYEAGDVQWRGSVAAGKPWRGALFRGAAARGGHGLLHLGLPWRTVPNRPWRRWATDRTIIAILGVLAEYRAAHPGAGRIGIADLSRPHGGDFGKRFGGLGHASHQNGVDADILYPPRSPGARAKEAEPDQPAPRPGPGEPVRGGGRSVRVRRAPDWDERAEEDRPAARPSRRPHARPLLRARRARN